MLNPINKVKKPYFRNFQNLSNQVHFRLV